MLEDERPDAVLGLPPRAYALPQQGRSVVRRRESGSVLRHAISNYDHCRRGLSMVLPSLSPRSGDQSLDGPLTPTPCGGAGPASPHAAAAYSVPRPSTAEPHSVRIGPGRTAVSPGASLPMPSPQAPPSQVGDLWWQRRTPKPPSVGLTELDSAYDCLKTELLGVVAKRQLEIDWLRDRMKKLTHGNSVLFANQLLRHNLSQLRWRTFQRMVTLVRQRWQRRAAETLLSGIFWGSRRVIWRKLLQWRARRRQRRERHRVTAALSRAIGRKVSAVYYNKLWLLVRYRRSERQTLVMADSLINRLRHRYWASWWRFHCHCRRRRAQTARAQGLLCNIVRGRQREYLNKLKRHRQRGMRARRDQKVAAKFGKSLGTAVVGGSGGKSPHEKGMDGVVDDRNPMWLCRPLHTLRMESYRKLREWSGNRASRRRRLQRANDTATFLCSLTVAAVSRKFFGRLAEWTKVTKILRRRHNCAASLLASTERRLLELYYHLFKSRATRCVVGYLRRLLGPLVAGPQGCETHEEAMRGCLEGDEQQWRLRCMRHLRRIEAPFGKTGSIGLSCSQRDVDGGVEVGGVAAGGPAERAGIKPGDIVTAVRNPRNRVAVAVRKKEELLRETGPLGWTFEGSVLILEVHPQGASRFSKPEPVQLTVGALGAAARSHRISRLYEAKSPVFGPDFNAEAVFELEHDPSRGMRHLRNVYDRFTTEETAAAGGLSLAEFRKVVSAVAETLGVTEPPKDKVDQALNEADVAMSGTLSFEESALFLRELFLDVVSSAGAQAGVIFSRRPSQLVALLSPKPLAGSSPQPSWGDTSLSTQPPEMMSPKSPNPHRRTRATTMARGHAPQPRVDLGNASSMNASVASNPRDAWSPSASVASNPRDPGSLPTSPVSQPAGAGPLRSPQYGRGAKPEKQEKQEKQEEEPKSGPQTPATQPRTPLAPAANSQAPVSAPNAAPTAGGAGAALEPPLPGRRGRRKSNSMMVKFSPGT
eukprot:TRINITY_DN55698_c0_g1_i1.p1 TRINITY_DN55698_c0_g1~~TRINITY_DN55698_c0_g1_i1.p1  ORF type:complete len:1022 (+),score=237.07 TRINITY_DN55698_c0_g1_i1:110-3067(+)